MAPCSRRRFLSTSFRTALVAAPSLTLAPSVKAALKLDITRGRVEPLPIAVTDFHGASDSLRERGSRISAVIADNMKRSALFQPIDQRAFIQEPASLQGGPRFSDWRQIDAQALVSGSASEAENGQLRVAFRLWDVFAEQQMTGLAYTTQPGNWRRIAHIISDAIYRELTGERGYFDTRIVYIAATGPQTERSKRLAIMDQDGANHRYLTDGANLVLTPRFSPTTQEITYVSYVERTPRVYLYNLNTGQREVVGDFPGMTFAPRFHPDGNRVIMALDSEGNADLYELDLRTRERQRLTAGPAIDISASYAPDGNRIVFNSNRGGSLQLYTMNADGTQVTRISFGDGRYATPVWSPRGDLIAFTRQADGVFYIGVMRPDGSDERMLTKGYRVEGPSWAPNGRVLCFFRRDRANAQGEFTSSLRTIDLTGFNEQELETPEDASDPSWSPPLP